MPPILLFLILAPQCQSLQSKSRLLFLTAQPPETPKQMPEASNGGALISEESGSCVDMHRSRQHEVNSQFALVAYIKRLAES